MRRRRVTVAIASALLLAGCAGSDADPTTPEETDHGSHHTTTEAAPSEPLRDGERFLDLEMPAAYEPTAPTEKGTDDYRCFLLDPKLTESAFVTGQNVIPDRADLVHHVILFRVGPDEVDDAKAADSDVKGEGWTCFGGPGVDRTGTDPLQNAPWLGAWAPGSGESILDPDIGIPLEPGSRIVMQVHYNLLAGSEPDSSKVRLRLAPASADLDPLRTMLLAAPVELPCRPGHSGTLCDRSAAVRDVADRFGGQAGFMVAGLQLMCGGDPNEPKAAPVQSCERTVPRDSTIRAVGGHMHLFGRSISITHEPKQGREHTVLDIPVWNFDDQRARSLKRPVEVTRGDRLRLTCRHDQSLRDDLPALDGTPERYIVWGEGTRDEMCLGIVLYTRP